MDTGVPTRRQLLLATPLICAAAFIGATAISQPHWVSALGALATLVSGIATVGALDGNRWTTRTRVAILGSAVLLATAFGLLARMVLHGLLVRGG
jgi:hypothetical protein